MTMTVTSTLNNTISMPVWLMKALNLVDGTPVQATVEGKSIRLSPIDDFLSLRGVFQDDDTFEDAINSLDKQWQAWTTNHSV